MYFFIAVVFIIMLAGLFGGWETGSYSVNRLRLDYRIKRNDSFALRLSENISKPEVFVFMTLVCQNICVYVVSSMVTKKIISLGWISGRMEFVCGFIPWSPDFAATYILTIPLFLFAELMPKSIFRHHCDILMYFTAYFQKAAIICCMPLIYPLSLLSSLISAKSKKELSDDFKNFSTIFKTYLSKGEDEGIISEHQRKMIGKTLQISSVRAEELMLPLEKTPVLDSETLCENALSSFLHSNLEVIPVYSGERKNIIGFAEFFDLVNSSGKKLKNIVAEPLKLPVDISADRAFYLFQEKKVSNGLLIQNGQTVGFLSTLNIAELITSPEITRK